MACFGPPPGRGIQKQTRPRVPGRVLRSAPGPAGPKKALIELDLDVHARRQVELHQGVHGLVRGVHDVHEALVGAELILVPRVLVGVRGDQHREALHLHRQRDGAADLGAGALGGLDDLLRRLVDETVVEGLEADADGLAGHVCYSMILATTPAPTVLPPSRMAKRRPSSMAIGLMSVTTILVLSPGITISVPFGSSQEPVTSVVRK